jgi:uncharacterized membrane protein
MLISCGVLVFIYLKPEVPKRFEKKYAKWAAFERALKSSRIKEHPPSSVVIWGKILVYATALGMTSRVKEHLSELDKLTLKRIEDMDQVRIVSYTFYSSAIRVSNLSKHGSRKGKGGFSKSSSGGWSSGGGGFSGGSSGGGGFR